MLKFFLIFILVIMLLRMLLRLFLPTIIKSVITNMQKKQGGPAGPVRPEGTTFVSGKPKSSAANRTDNSGDYVDYEEIKD
jgi:hypothetical protein